MVALGITNAGKSDLLSALADKKDLFVPRDVPKFTRDIQEEGVGCLQLIDTPGLDADKKDTRLAMKEAQAADTILWCHSVRKGELRPTELDALREYSKEQGSIWRTCFVLTHCDNVANLSIVDEVSSVIAEQLSQIFHLDFMGRSEEAKLKSFDANSGRKPRPFNYVGTKNYWRATLGDSVRGSDYLLNRSGIPRLRSFLEHLASKK